MPKSNSLVGWLPGLTNAKRIKVVGDHAVVLAAHGITTVNISGPPVLVANSNIVFNGLDMALLGSLVAATGTRIIYNEDGSPKYLAGIYFIDIGNPESPQLVGKVETDTTAPLGSPVPVYFGIALDENFAYVGTQGELVVVDVVNASIVERVPSPGTVNGVTLLNRILYLASGDAGLVIRRASSPFNQLGFFDTPGSAQHVALFNGTAYVSDLSSLQIVDVSNVEAPKFKGVFAQWQAVSSVIVSGVAYLSAQRHGLKLVNVSDPTNPTLITALSPAPAYNAVTLASCVVGSAIYLANGEGGIGVVSVSGQPPGLSQTAIFTDCFYGSRITQVRPGLVAVAGTRITEARFKMRGGVRFVDVSDPAKPRVAGEYLSPSNLNYSGMAIKGNLLFITAGPDGVRTLIFSDLNNIVQGPKMDTAGWCQAAAIDGDKLYLADGRYGLRVANISNPAAIVPLGSVDTNYNAHDVAVSGNTAYIADGSALVVIDVSLFAPSIKKIIHGHAVSVQVEGNKAFVGATHRGLAVVDFANPDSPSLVRLSPLPTFPRNTLNAHRVGNLVCLANSFDGVLVADVSNPAAPQHAASTRTADQVFDVVQDGNYAYLADAFGTLSVVDLR